MDDAESIKGLCANMKDVMFGSTFWRGKGKTKKQVKKDVKKNPLDEQTLIFLSGIKESFNNRPIYTHSKEIGGYKSWKFKNDEFTLYYNKEGHKQYGIKFKDQDGNILRTKRYKFATMQVLGGAIGAIQLFLKEFKPNIISIDALLSDRSYQKYTKLLEDMFEEYSYIDSNTKDGVEVYYFGKDDI